MAEDIEGLSNTVPLRAQTGGPLHLLKQAPALPSTLTLHPEPWTPNPNPSTLNPKP